MNYHRRNRPAGRGHDAQARVVRHGTPAAIRDWLGGLAGNQSGTVALLFALVLIPLAVAVGFAVDFGRAYAVKARLSYALDAAGLAVGSSVGTDAELQEILQNYFDANYPAEEFGVPAVPSMQIVDNVINLSVTANLDTVLMRIVGHDQIDIAVVATIIKETKGLEVVLALDNTGSMSGSKIASLRDAATEMVNTLFGQQEVAELLTMGVVPFSQTVNVGEANASLLDGYDAADYNPGYWRGCVEARNYPHDSRDTSIAEGGGWSPYLWPSNRYRGYFGNRWPRIRGTRGQVRGPNKLCPVPLQPLTNVKQDVLNALSDMEAIGITHINFGAVWGWRVLSPEEPFTEGLPYDDPDSTKAIIIMTDGDNTMYRSRGSYSAYGFLAEGRLGTRSSWAARSELDDRLIEVCSEMKARDILVFTITFRVGSNFARNLMRSCASGDGQYFDSPSNAELTQVFRAIGTQLSNLRIGS